eukprot:6262379-Karenia_brevis.AAC.1
MQLGLCFGWRSAALVLSSSVSLLARLVVSDDDVANMSVPASISKSTATPVNPYLAYCFAVRALIDCAQ